MNDLVLLLIIQTGRSFSIGELGPAAAPDRTCHFHTFLSTFDLENSSIFSCPPAYYRRVSRKWSQFWRGNFQVLFEEIFSSNSDTISRRVKRIWLINHFLIFLRYRMHRIRASNAQFSTGKQWSRCVIWIYFSIDTWLYQKLAFFLL